MTQGWSRRRLLAALGAGGGLAGVAGCLESRDTVEGSVDDDPDAFGLPFHYVTENTQLNRWAGGFPWTAHALLFEHGVVSAPEGSYELTDLVEAVDLDGATATVTYADDHEWWSGEPVTARDRYVHERIQAYVRRVDDDGPVPDDPDELADPATTDRPAVDLVDDRTIEYEFPRPLSRPLALERTLGEAHTVASWYFDPHLEALGDASTRDARETLVEDLREDTITLEDAREEGYGCGPYRLREVSPNRIILDPDEDHPRADGIDVSRIWLPIAREIHLDQLVETGDIDGWHASGRTDRSPPDHVERVTNYHTELGTKLAFNWTNPHVGRTGVRRAIAALIPLEAIGEVGNFGDHATIQSGMTVPNEERWLDDETRESLHRYPIENDVDVAAEYMHDAGYERDGERWIAPDGRDVALRFKTPTWDAWFAAAEVIDDALRSFGFDVEITQDPVGGLYGSVQTGDFDLLLWPTDGRPHVVYDVTSDQISALGYDVDDPETDRSPLDKPVSPSVPDRPGAIDAGDDGRERVNLVEEWRRIEGPTPESETVDAVGTFARWYNDALPDLDVATAKTTVWGNVREFTWPESDDRRYRLTGSERQPVHRLLTTGAIGRDR